MPQSPPSYRKESKVLNSLLVTKGHKGFWAVLIRGQLPSPPPGTQVGRVTPSLVRVPTPSHKLPSPNTTLAGITRPSKVKGKLLALKGDVLAGNTTIFACISFDPSYHAPNRLCVNHCAEHWGDKDVPRDPQGSPEEGGAPLHVQWVYKPSTAHCLTTPSLTHSFSPWCGGIWITSTGHLKRSRPYTPSEYTGEWTVAKMTMCVRITPQRL